MTDTLGILERYDDEALSVRRADGSLATIARDQVVTGKPVPPRESIRARIPAEALQRICTRGWCDEVERLGSWELRYGGGFSRRANSALIVGAPGGDWRADTALDEVVSRYRSRGLAPLVMSPTGSDAHAWLLGRGWIDTTTGADVLMASAAHIRRAAQADPHLVRLTHDRADVAHLQRDLGGADPAVVERIYAAGDQVTYAAIGDTPIATGRAVVTGDWLGISAVNVAPEHRRRGHASAILEALVGWGLESGAGAVYVQVEPGNEAARALYEAYGFAEHHAYAYLAPPRES